MDLPYSTNESPIINKSLNSPIDGQFPPKPPENTREYLSSIFKQYTETPPQLRLGLRLVNGLSDAAASRIVAARAISPFSPFIDIADLKRRTSIDEGDIKAVAAADAFASLAGNRRHALWSALGTGRDAAMLIAPTGDGEVALRAPTDAADLVARANNRAHIA